MASAQVANHRHRGLASCVRSGRLQLDDTFALHEETMESICDEKGCVNPAEFVVDSKPYCYEHWTKLPIVIPHQQEVARLVGPIPPSPVTLKELIEQREKSMAQFQTGATRNASDHKPDYEGFLSPLVIERFGEYMNQHRHTADGGLRASDNWMLGIPREAYMKSLWRHFLSVWKRHRGWPVTPEGPREPQNIEDDLCAIIFNAQGMLHEIIKERVKC
jgi:hypothetical protein